jgi:hypothetical protein
MDPLVRVNFLAVTGGVLGRLSPWHFNTGGV